MAVIGQQLKAPEVGWKRYNNTVPPLALSGSWAQYAVTGSYTGKNIETTSESARLKFKFKGTKIRVMVNHADNREMVATLIVDGTTYTANTQLPSGQLKAQMLTFEVQGLDDGIHEVEYLKGTSDTSVLDFDSVDIDATGRLVHPDEVLSVHDLEVGKRIRANYKSFVSGKPGLFTRLGLETSNFIPITSSATPNGDFYFIMVEDKNGKQKLIADRFLQHTVSWDNLNAYGFVSGLGQKYVLDTWNNNYIHEPIREDLMLVGDMTLSMKLLLRAYPTAARYLVVMSAYGDSDDTNALYSLSIDTSGKLYYFHEGGSSGGTNISLNLGYTVPVNEIVDITVTRDSVGKKVHLFVNDEFVSTVSYTTAPKKAAVGAGKQRLQIACDTFSNGNIANFTNMVLFNFAIDNQAVDPYAYTDYKDYKYNEEKLYVLNPFSREGVDATVRLMTGGTTSTDKDNEYDQFIVPGDNAKWNWNVNISGWTSTVDGTLNTHRIRRGSQTDVAGYFYSGNATLGLSSTAHAQTGFRPVLIIELSEVIPDNPNGTVLYEVQSGFLFKDDFKTFNSRWTATPVGSYSVTDRPDFISLKHHLTNDTMILANVLDDMFAFEVHADYTPSVEGDEGGVIIWKNSEEKIEFLETVDANRTANQKAWMVLKEGNDWRFFSDEGQGFSFLDSDIIEATKFGVVLKRGSNPAFTNLDVDKIIATRGNLLTVMNVLPGQLVRLTRKDGTIMAEDFAVEGTAVQLQMPYLEIEGKLEIISEEGTSLNSVEGIFYGGDVYSIGTEIQVRMEDMELSRTRQTDIGTMIGGVLQVKMNVYNPATMPVYNVTLALQQYTNKFGWEWVDIAFDNNGIPDVYGDVLTIDKINGQAQVDFWVKVTKGTDYMGLEPLQFNIHLEHS